MTDLSFNTINNNAIKQPSPYSSCIAVFNHYAQAEKGVQSLLKAGVEKTHISIVGIDVQQGEIGKNGVDKRESFTLAGVPKAQFYCYQCLIHSGSYLLIVTGDHTTIEDACELLEKMEKVNDVSIHFS